MVSIRFILACLCTYKPILLLVANLILIDTQEEVQAARRVRHRGEIRAGTRSLKLDQQLGTSPEFGSLAFRPRILGVRGLGKTCVYVTESPLLDRESLLFVASLPAHLLSNAQPLLFLLPSTQSFQLSFLPYDCHEPPTISQSGRHLRRRLASVSRLQMVERASRPASSVYRREGKLLERASDGGYVSRAS